MPAVPGADLGECIRADQEIEILFLGERGSHPLDGFNRITVLLALFEARRFKPRLTGAGQFHHAVPVFIGSPRGAGLMRRARGRNE